MYTHKVVIQILGDMPANQTFTGHVVAKISQCQSIISQSGDPVYDGGDPRDLGDDVGHTGKLSTWGESRAVWAKDLHDAVIDYSIKALGIPIAQELESTPKSIVSYVKGRRYRERWGECSRHITKEIESKLISDCEHIGE